MTTEAPHCDYCCGEACCAHEFAGCPMCGKGWCHAHDVEDGLVTRWVCWECQPKVPCAGGCGREVVSGKCLRCVSGEKTLHGAMARVVLGVADDMREQLDREALVVKAFMGKGDDEP